jgi:Tfp pilus assembly protein PilF
MSDESDAIELSSHHSSPITFLMAKQKRRGKGGKLIEIPRLVNAETGAESQQPQEKPRPRVARASGRRNWRLEFLVVLPALLLGVFLYVNTLHGEFVYDDKPQIARNTLIQDDANLWRAMFSDVWAFKRGDAAAVSNYWRPTFVLWLIINFQLFGLDTFGWHFLNILLHVAVTALAFLLLRRMKVSLWVAGVIALIFAAHPAHTESVAWISGSPDLILSLALLGSMWFVNQLGKERTKTRWALAMALYLIALGAKEIAIFYPVIVLVMLWRPEREYGEEGVPWSKALTIALPFAAVAVLYFIIRQSILGQLAQWPEGGADLKSTILSAPMVFSFYLRQIVFPFQIGPSYPLRAVTLANIGVGNFVVPLIVSLVAGGWMLWRARQSKLARIGLALFALPLLPAMNIAAFVPEQIVHDRYLYLPLLGFLIMVVPAIASLFERVKVIEASRRQWLVYAVAVALCIPLGVQTIRYNRAWLSNDALWQWALRIDPNSAYNYVQYGAELYGQKRFEEAAQTFDRALKLNPLPLAHLGRGRSLTELKQFEEAERNLRAITSKPTEQMPSHPMYLAYEALAVNYERQGKLSEAANTLTEARNRLPQYKAALTEKLAIILYQGGKKQEAYAQLDSVRAQAKEETLPESRFVFYRIGLLAAEMGKNGEARAAFQEYLAQTKHLQDPEFKETRADAEAALRRLPR